MVHARVALFSHMREFVARDLAGLYTWDDTRPGLDHLADLRPDGRRNVLGNFKEISEIAFGDYVLRVLSSEERPPVGLVELECNGKLIDSGPIDQSTWDRLAKFIRDRESKD